MKVVCDSSALIALARTNHLDILEKGVKRLIIPQSVFNEVVIKGAGKPGSDEIKEAKLIETKNVSNEEHTLQG